MRASRSSPRAWRNQRQSRVAASRVFCHPLCVLLGGVRLPAEILTAQEAGELVIFTGAGISIDPPSNLPGFAGLAGEVARRLHSPLNPESPGFATPLDAFMGELNENDEVNVHQLVQGIVTDPNSRPNPNHEALARIAANGKVRVVTTNYDLHLETTLRERVEHLQAFQAPALPLGDDFEGIVYLHGSAAGPPRHLVVTDRDFSGAYFHSAWAARFLERMFREYTVLFVGYSHADIVMKYLGLGVGPKSLRYALTDQPEDPLWERLRVRPVEYPHKNFEVLTRCLSEWADYGELGLLDHRQRIRELVSSASSPTPEELSYLQSVLRRPGLVKFFCEFAKDRYWLEWVRSEEPFETLFTRPAHAGDSGQSAAAEDVTSRLAGWFAQRFALANDDLAEEAWATVANAGGVLGTDLWDALAWRFFVTDNPRSDRLLRWVWLLIEQEHPGCRSGDFLDMALGLQEVWDDEALRLALLEHLMTPHLAPTRTFGSPRMKVKTRAVQHVLDDVWGKRFLPEIATTATQVLPVAERALMRHLNLECQLGGRGFGFSRSRSAIQPHEQDRYRESIDAVIDAVRDCAEALWTTDPQAAEVLVEGWIGSDHALMRRLAVHVVGSSPTWSADDKVRFVLEHDLAGGLDVSQEVFHLLESAAKDAAADEVDRLVAKLADSLEGERDQYRAFTALEWLERSGVENSNLATELDSLRQILGNVEPERYPGMLSWSEGGGISTAPPLSIDDFDTRIRESPHEAVEFVLSFEDTIHRRSGEPRRDDAVSMLRDTVGQRPKAGLELWPHVAVHPDLRHAVVSAWGHAHEVEDLTAIIEVLLDADLGTMLPAIGQLLIHAVSSREAPWEQLPRIGELVEKVWAACATRDTYDPASDRDWLTDTINTPAGLLMEFWFELFRRRWAAAGDAWDGLPEGDRAFLEQALADTTVRGSYALTQAAGRLHFLDAADSDWCRRRLLPRRDWADVGSAEPFWWGALNSARLNGGLVEAGLLEGLIETTPHLGRFDEEQRRRWAALLAAIAVRYETPAADSWVGRFTATTDATDRALWIDAVADELGNLPDQGRVSTWEGWLGGYWKRRGASDPVAVTKVEADSLASVALYVPYADLAAAVELVIATPAGFDAHGTLAHELSDELVDTQPRAVGQLLTHLMKNTELPFWGGYALTPKLKRLVALPGDWRQLREAALRLDIDLT